VGTVEFEAEAAIELGSKWLRLAVTHQRSLSGWQETSENPGKPGGIAQVLCHTQGFILGNPGLGVARRDGKNQADSTAPRRGGNAPSGPRRSG
jgi:hypothetical protein